MLQKDGFFRRRDEGLFRQSQPIVPAPAPAANSGAAPASHVEAKVDERKEAKLVVGPDIKMKGVEISDCDTLVVEGRIEATLDSRVLEITAARRVPGHHRRRQRRDPRPLRRRADGAQAARHPRHRQGAPARSATPRSRSRKARSSPAKSRCSTRRSRRPPSRRRGASAPLSRTVPERRRQFNPERAPQAAHAFGEVFLARRRSTSARSLRPRARTPTRARGRARARAPASCRTRGCRSRPRSSNEQRTSCRRRSSAFTALMS